VRPTNASPAGNTHGLGETRGEPIELPAKGANAGQGYDIGGGGSPSGGNRRPPPTIIFLQIKGGGSNRRGKRIATPQRAT